MFFMSAKYQSATNNKNRLCVSISVFFSDILIDNYSF